MSSGLMGDRRKVYPSREELQKSFGFKMRSQYRLRTLHGDDAVADLLPLRQNPPVYSLKYISVPDDARGEGMGSKLLQVVLQEADKTHSIITLDPVAAGEMSTAELEKWYARHGFVSTRGTNLSPMSKMVYYPKGG